MTRRRLVAAALAALAVLGACSGRDDDADEVRRAIEATDLLPHRFRYTEAGPDRTLTVDGIVEDDLRAKLRLSADGGVVAEQTVVDDAVAMRFLDREWVDDYVDPQVGATADLATNLRGVTVLDALVTRHWVVDDAGAPALIPSADALPAGGDDPLGEARRALDHVRDVVDRFPLVQYDHESVSPTYRPDEDPFPVPEEGAAVQRYDVAQPPLPSVADATGGATPQLPTEAHFRRMAIYVRAGRVVRVMEHIGVTPRLLDDLSTLMRGIVRRTAPPDVHEGFRATADRLRGDALATFLLDGLNSFVELRGDPPIRFRTVTLELRDLGDEAIEVELPASRVTGDLAVLHGLGDKPVAGDDGGAEAASP